MPAQWAAFDWQDPFLLEQQLSEEERMVRIELFSMRWAS